MDKVLGDGNEPKKKSVFKNIAPTRSSSSSSSPKVNIPLENYKAPANEPLEQQELAFDQVPSNVALGVHFLLFISSISHWMGVQIKASYIYSFKETWQFSIWLSYRLYSQVIFKTLQKTKNDLLWLLKAQARGVDHSWNERSKPRHAIAVVDYFPLS